MRVIDKKEDQLTGGEKKNFKCIKGKICSIIRKKEDTGGHSGSQANYGLNTVLCSMTKH